MKRPERLLYSDKRAFMGDDIITALFIHYDNSGECPIYLKARLNPKDETYEASIYSTSKDNIKLFTPEELLHACLSGSLKPENKEHTDETKNLTSYDIMRYVISFETRPIPQFQAADEVSSTVRDILKNEYGVGDRFVKLFNLNPEQNHTRERIRALISEVVQQEISKAKSEITRTLEAWNENQKETWKGFATRCAYLTIKEEIRKGAMKAIESALNQYGGEVVEDRVELNNCNTLWLRE